LGHHAPEHRRKEIAVKHVKPFALLCAAALAITSVVIAQDGGARSDSTDRPRARLVKPWSELKSLSEEQKQQIIQIHADANEAMRKIREKERTDIMALLSEENKTELAALMEKERADAKARRAAASDKDDKDAKEGDK
jgi:hypothetical protein